MAEVGTDSSNLGQTTQGVDTGQRGGGFGEILDVLNLGELRGLLKSQSFLFTVAFIMSIALILVPLPGAFLDFFMILNLILALVVMITIINTKNNLEFSIFPTILLWGTLFRLVINVSSTRLILSKGLAFDGQVVRAFSDFVSSGSFLIGLIIFIIIITVQFLVITRGANRASEVSARFRLDSLPGKQIAIDADLSSGLINEDEAIRRREEVQKEADFYGSMDGASKFINGEVIASIVIVFINIIGGILTGMVVRSETISQAVESYLKFAIGDGLVAAIPSLIIAIAAGIVVTRTISKKNIAEDLFDQMMNNYSIFYILAVFIFLLSFLPGFPSLVMIPVSGLAFFLAYTIQRREQVRGKFDPGEEVQVVEPEGELTIEKIADNIQVDTIEIELGNELLVFADPNHGGSLAERVKNCRRQLGLELGMLVPQVRMSDNMQLKRNGYQIKVYGSVVGDSLLEPDKVLAIDSTGGKQEIEGRELVKDPAFGINAYWITDDETEAFEKKGFTVADIPTIITTHLMELIKENASDITGRKETKAIVDSVRNFDETLVKELENVPGYLGLVQKVLGSLLEENISIRNIRTILEVVCDRGVKLNQEDLIEAVRQKLSKQICSSLSDDARNLNVIRLSEVWETKLLNSINQTETGKFLNLEPAVMKDFLLKLRDSSVAASESGYSPILLVDEYLRKLIRNIVKKTFKDLQIISQQEIADGFFINIVETVNAKI